MSDQQTSALKDQIALLSFVEDLIRERKDPHIKPENIAQVKAMLLKEVNDAINRHLISLLSEKDQVELDELLEKNVSDKEINDFFMKKVPHLEAEIASILLHFRKAYLPAAPSTQAAPQATARPDFPPPAPVPVDKIN